MRLIGALIALGAVTACSKEAPTLGPTPPQTRPADNADPRIPAYQDNVYQVAQGARYFAWYGCSECHSDDASGARRLADGRWQYGGGFAEVFGAVADRHGRLDYGRRIPVEQLWQLTAYVRDLPLHTAEKRRRADLDQQAEPRGASWSGPQ